MSAHAVVCIALRLVAAGLPVFPCGSNKMPAKPKSEGGRGFHDATTDPAIVRRLFDRRNAVLIGVPTGERSGFDVLDLDYRHGAAEWEQANLNRLPETRIHETRSGGRHMLFLHAPGVRNSAGRIAPGVDVRGEGGFVVWWPAPGIPIISDAPIAHWPDWLLQLALPPPRPASTAGNSGPVQPISSELLEEIRRRALDRVRGAAEGAKHFTLRNSALLLGGIVDQAGVCDRDAVRWLLEALPSSVRVWENARRTAEWGVANGRRNPITFEEKPRPPPDPRRKQTARAAFRLLRMGVASRELLAVLHEQNQRRSEPLPADEIDDTAIWAATRQREHAHAG
jgi:bifunctional DNA primase/polymerase-like protein/primase-like protein